MKILITDSQLNKIIEEQKTNPISLQRGKVKIGDHVYQLMHQGQNFNIIELSPHEGGGYDIKINGNIKVLGFEKNVTANRYITSDTLNHIMSNLGQEKIEFVKKDKTRDKDNVLLKVN